MNTDHRRLDGQALDDAIQRLSEARLNQDTSKCYAPLAETLFWIVRLDDWWSKAFPAGVDQYRQERNASVHGRVIRGTHFVRNLVTHEHDYFSLVEITEGAQFPLQLPFAFFEVRWKPSIALPKLNRFDRDGMTAHTQYLEANPVRLTMLDALRFFRSLKTTVNDEV